MVRLEDLKQQYPEPPEFIHQMILNNRSKVIRKTMEKQQESGERENAHGRSDGQQPRCWRPV